MDAMIHDRGRGPEIVGTRITVYDVLDYAETRTPEFIAELFKVEVEQIHAALAYIETHREEVMVEYRKMLARAEAGNPPEVQAILDEAGDSFRKLLEIQRRSPSRLRAVLDGRRDDPAQYRRLVEEHYSAMTAEVERAGNLV